MSTPRPTAPALFTNDFDRAFEAETSSLLGLRFRWFTGIVGGATLVAAILATIATIARQSSGEAARPAGVAWTGIAVTWAVFAIYAASFAYTAWRRIDGERLLALSYRIVIAHGVVQLAGFYLLNSGGGRSPWVTLVEIGGAHLLASLFLPWTASQAMRPVIILVIINTIGLLSVGPGTTAKTLTILLSPLVGVPGVAVCWFRHSRRMERLKLKFLQTRYGQVRRELVDARKIHEALFPQRIATGPVRFDYRYEPMHQLGGDFLHLHAEDPGDESGRLSVVIMDVTGHGIPAALTVNRLHGEIGRIFAENPATGPGQLVRLLNRYVHLTLSSHSVYMTAICVRLCPEDGRLEYASAGHPPAFVCAIDGTVQELESTALVLGAAPDEEFEHGERSIAFGPGDALVAYTDGATEARDHAGRMLGVAGMRQAIASRRHRVRQGWCEEMLKVVDKHRAGPPADDTLIVEISRPIGAGVASRPKAAVREPGVPEA